MAAVLDRLVGITARLRGDAGFGVIELLIAMTVMAVGIMAIVAGFSSGIVALNNASRTGTAGTLADKQMEAYRALSYDQIALKGSLVSSAPANTAPYTPLTGDSQTGAINLTETYVPSSSCGTASPIPVTCMPVQSVTGPDGRAYRVDTYIVWACPVPTLGGTASAPTCTGARPVKKITVATPRIPRKPMSARPSTFDAAT